MRTPSNRFTIDLQRLAFEHFDSCTSCGHAFVEAEHSCSGYLGNGEPAYVCDKCSEQLSELAARTYFMPRPYKVPAPEAKLWRYMDFTKYVSLLTSRALYFSRSDQFEDAYEGAKGLKRRKGVWDDHYLNFFRQAIRNPPDGYECDKTDDQVEEEANRLLRDLETGGNASRAHTFISCWHESLYESAAMWRLYSSFLPNAVAIKTSYSALYTSLGRDPQIRIGRVRYIDFKSQYAGINDAYWRKRKSFEHEREVRAVITDFSRRGVGSLIPCDVELLIESVYLSPQAPGWFMKLVNDVNRKFGIEVEAGPSEFNEEPFF
ncbi:hypothetical protein [Tahibacter sp.]|uniref:hypothetical protein n=1 Tax=Tahibacter sp. TaxID=2056211 RepID=UPI0028C4A049|nr:hypothetical protein [Tahibacter sp.]